MTIVCIANPTSGGGAGAVAIQAVQRSLNSSSIAVVVRQTNGMGAARRIASDIVSGTHEALTHVIVIGGDGTLSEVVDGLLGATLRLSCIVEGPQSVRPMWHRVETVPSVLPKLVYVPAGTGSDFARLGHTCTPEDVGAAVASGAAIPIDVGYVSHLAENGVVRYFINVASIGLGAAVVRRAERIKKTWVAVFGGLVIFFIASAIELFLMRPFDVVVRPAAGADDALVDDASPPVPYRTTMTTMAFCNGRFFGGGMKIAPRADVRDGRLNLSVWREGMLGFLLGIISVYTGRAASWRTSSNFVFQDLYVGTEDGGLPNMRRSDPLRFEVDGELGSEVPALVGLAPLQLHFAVPPEGVSAV